MVPDSQALLDPLPNTACLRLPKIWQDSEIGGISCHIKTYLGLGNQGGIRGEGG